MSQQISAKVTDAAGKPVEMATVALFKVSDSILVKTCFTEANGKFLFEHIKTGEYLIRISAMGYRNYESTAITLRDSILFLPDIVIQGATRNLDEVVVTSRKLFIERKIDRTVVNVDALIANAGTTALDVLEKSPGVVLDQNNGISLKGKQGVMIFIDGKPSYLSGADLENYLRSIPSSLLDQIEIMTNPPAKYDAAGSAGVINIKMKKGRAGGFNAGLNLGLTQGKLTRTNNSFNFNYQRSRINIFGSLSQGYENGFNDLDINRRYYIPDGTTQSYFEQQSYVRRKGNVLNAKAGVDYYLSDKTTWGIQFTGIYRSSSKTNDNTSLLLNNKREEDSIIRANSLEKPRFTNGGVNINYRHKFDEDGHEITFDADYITYSTNGDATFNNAVFLPDNSLSYQDRLDGNLPSDINISAVKADYSRNIRKGWKLSAGLKSSYTETDNVVSYFYTRDNITTPDYDKSNHFIYRENINAAYANLMVEGKHLSMQAGLRFENTNANGHQLGNAVKNDSSFNRGYTDLFPTLYFSYKLDTLADHQLGLNYGKRINRPYYQDLNPFISPKDKFTYLVGNPFLKPSFTNSVELSYTYKSKVTLAMNFSEVKNNIMETIEMQQGIYYSRQANIGKLVYKSISVDAGFDITKWLYFHTYMEFGNIHSRSDFYTGLLDVKGNYGFVGPDLHLKFNKGWSAEISGMYISKLYEAQFVSNSYWQANAGMQKILTPRASIKLNVSDLFYTKLIGGTINNLAFADAGFRNRMDSRAATLTFSYKFGKARAPGRDESTGAESEQKRVKE